MQRDLHDVAKQRGKEMMFYCPNGHPQYFVEGETELDKLRRERDRLTQVVAQKNDEIAHERARVVAAKGTITKLKKRAKAGTCPCCQRTFSNMAAHMKTQHPDFDPKVVDLENEKRKRA